MNILAILAASAAMLPVDTVAQQRVDTVAGSERNLDDLVVEVKKQVVKSTGDKLTYDMEQDKASKGATLLDALRRVPLVAVSGDDKITVNGSGSFQIYVNGKPNPMLTQNYSTMFKAMPAEAVAKIEVITEPGAKYDAEGTGAILNLITLKVQKTNGYAGSASVMLSPKTNALAGFGALKRDKVSMESNLTLALSGYAPASSSSTEDAVDSRDGSRIVSGADQSFDYNLVRGSLNLTYEPNTQDLFTIGGDVNSLMADSKWLNTRQTVYAGSSLVSDVSQVQDATIKRLATSLNASYQHNFARSGNYLILSYLFNFGRTPMHLYARGVNELDPTQVIPFTANLNNDYTREHTGQIDYALPLGGEKHLFETGGKLIVRRNSTYSYSLVGADREHLVANPLRDVMMNQNQDIAAAYASYSASWGNWSAKGGVRYEYTAMGTESLLGAKDSYISHLNDVVPNAAVAYNFSPVSNLRLAYQMRISRPTLSQVTPFKMQIMEGYVQTGNPDLSSERDNNVSLTYSGFFGVIGGRMAVSYNTTSNAVAAYNYYEGDTRYSSYLNIGSRDKLSLTPMLMVNLSNKFNAQLSGNLSYVSLRADKQQNQGWTGDYTASLSYSLPLGLNLMGYGGQTFRGIEYQGTGVGTYYYGAALSRNFLKNKALQVSLRANNFINEYVSFSQKQEVGTRIINTTGKYGARDITLSIGWQFGNLRERAKKTAVKIENDDKINAKSSGGGGGVSIGM